MFNSAWRFLVTCNNASPSLGIFAGVASACERSANADDGEAVGSRNVRRQFLCGGHFLPQGCPVGIDNINLPLLVFTVHSVIVIEKAVRLEHEPSLLPRLDRTAWNHKTNTICSLKLGCYDVKCWTTTVHSYYIAFATRKYCVYAKFKLTAFAYEPGLDNYCLFVTHC